MDDSPSTETGSYSTMGTTPLPIASSPLYRTGGCLSLKASGLLLQYAIRELCKSLLSAPSRRLLKMHIVAITEFGCFRMDQGWTATSLEDFLGKSKSST